MDKLLKLLTMLIVLMLKVLVTNLHMVPCFCSIWKLFQMFRLTYLLLMLIN